MLDLEVKTKPGQMGRFMLLFSSPKQSCYFSNINSAPGVMPVLPELFLFLFFLPELFHFTPHPA